MRWVPMAAVECHIDKSLVSRNAGTVIYFEAYCISALTSRQNADEAAPARRSVSAGARYHA